MKKTGLTIEVTKQSPNKANLYNKVSFVKSSYKLYFNAQHLLIKLDPYQRCYYDYLCEMMVLETNNVFVDKVFQTGFLAHLTALQIDTKILKEKNGYLEKLKDLGLILATGEQCCYIVNPKYAFKESESKRKKCLKELIQTRIDTRQSLLHLLSIPEIAFYNNFR